MMITRPTLHVFFMNSVDPGLQIKLNKLIADWKCFRGIDSSQSFKHTLMQTVRQQHNGFADIDKYTTRTA